MTTTIATTAATDHIRITNAFFNIQLLSIQSSYNSIRIYIYIYLSEPRVLVVCLNKIHFSCFRLVEEFFFLHSLYKMNYNNICLIYLNCLQMFDKWSHFFSLIQFAHLFFFIFIVDVTAIFRRRLERAKWTKLMNELNNKWKRKTKKRQVKERKEKSALVSIVDLIWFAVFWKCFVSKYVNVNKDENCVLNNNQIIAIFSGKMLLMAFIVMVKICR